MAFALDHLQDIDTALSGAPLALLSDVDGTLSDIVAQADDARVRPELRELLRGLVSKLPFVAVITGRAPDQVREMVGVDGIVYIGNHGLERLENGERHIHPVAAEYLPRVKAALEEVGRAVRMPGLFLEDKGITAAVHYRNVAEATGAEAALRQLAVMLPALRELRINWGRMVMEIRPPVSIDKGTAATELVEEQGLRRAIYIGDDTTDIDVFEAFHTLQHQKTDFRGLGFAVLSGETPASVAAAADYTLRGIDEVADLLRWLTERVNA